MKLPIAVMRPLPDVNVPLGLVWRVMIPTMFSQLPEVGVKCSSIGGLRSSQARFTECLRVASFVVDDVQRHPRVSLGNLLEERLDLLVRCRGWQMSTTLPVATSRRRTVWLVRAGRSRRSASRLSRASSGRIGAVRSSAWT